MSTLSRRDLLKVAGAAGVVPLLGSGPFRRHKGPRVICERFGPLTLVQSDLIVLNAPGHPLTFHVYDQFNNLIPKQGSDSPNPTPYQISVPYQDDPYITGNRLYGLPWPPSDSLSLPAKVLDGTMSYDFSKLQFTVKPVNAPAGSKEWQVQVECLPIYTGGTPQVITCCLKCGTLEYCIAKGNCIMCGAVKYCC